MKLKKVFAGIAAAATMLGGLALGATTANAAEGDASTITITGDVAGRTFTAYPLGTYTNVVTNAGKTAVTSVDFTQNTEWIPSLADIVKSADINVPTEYTGNELAYVATLSQTTDGAKLRAFAQKLTEATTKPANPTVANAADNATSVDLDVPAEGWYLVTDSLGSPILVGTSVTVDGKAVNKLNTQTLGTAVAKPTTVPTPGKKADVAGSEDDSTVKFGDTVNYTVTGKVPNTTGYSTYTYGIKDTASKGLNVNADSIVVKIGGTTLTKDTDYTVMTTGDATKGTTTEISIENVAGLDGQTVTVTYTATVTADAENGKVENTAAVSHNGSEYGQGETVPLTYYGFQFTKTDADGKALAGAEFKLKQGGNYYVKAQDGKWSTTTDASEATVFTSGEDGVVAFAGLAAGDYTVEETKAPAGFLQNALAVFDVTLGGANPVLKTTSNVLKLASQDAETHAITVKNVTSITQLPLTGAAGTALFTLIGVLLAGAAVTVIAKNRNTKRALNA